VTGRVENLKPWKPGQSGNPGGRPKRDVASEIAQAIFEQDAEAILAAFSKALKKGDSRVFTALADRAYGKAKKSVEHAGEDGGPIQTSISVRFVKPNPGGN
jgi:Family of unknown function (DUF5681)